MNKKFLVVVLTLIIVIGAILVLIINNPAPDPKESGDQRKSQSSPAVLAQCKLDLQSSAIRPGTVLNWTEIGITACYELKLKIEPSSDSFKATAEITYTNTTGRELSELIFRLYPNSPLIFGGRMDISNVSQDKKGLDFTYFLDKTAVLITPLSSIKPEETVRLSIDYSISLPADYGSSHVYGVFNHSSQEKIYTFANWFPILAIHDGNQWIAEKVDGIGDAVTSQTALFVVEITAPVNWEVVTTGYEISVKEDSGFEIHSFVSGPVRDFMVVASPDFEFENRSVNSIQVRQWGLRDTKNGWNKSLETASSSIDLFSSLYGNYPYREIDVVAVPLNIAIGVEYPGLVLISQKDYQPGVDNENELTVVVAHEVAHQWWYAVVGNDVSAYPWQDEGLTTFSTLEFLKRYHPGISTYLRNSYQQKADNYERDNGKEPFNQPVGAFTSKPAAYSTLVYGKAALFFVALQEKIGDQAVNAALKAYYMNNSYDIAWPDDLLTAFSSACNCDLTRFYESWGLKN